ncbi:MAG: hypothetical protein ACRDZ8_03165 [Acidimicrobiales bacterium]
MLRTVVRYGFGRNLADSLPDALAKVLTNLEGKVHPSKAARTGFHH